MKAKKYWKRITKHFAGRASDELFGGHDQLFKEAVRISKVYGEYGCGASTLWVAKNTQAHIVSVESDPTWAERVIADKTAPGRLSMRLVDIGPVRRLGRPLDYSKRANFKDYAEALWNTESMPDTVLIDGRFRVYCFLTSLLRAPAGAMLIFDDYFKRPQYHLVEELIGVSAQNDRQAVFLVPKRTDMDINYISNLQEKFEFVMD